MAKKPLRKPPAKRAPKQTAKRASGPAKPARKATPKRKAREERVPKRLLDRIDALEKRNREVELALTRTMGEREDNAVLRKQNKNLLKVGKIREAQLLEAQQNLEAFAARIRFLERNQERIERGLPARNVTIQGQPKPIKKPPMRQVDARKLLLKQRQEILSEEIMTRVRADFIFVRNTETPCNANAFIKTPGIKPLREALRAMADTFGDQYSYNKGRTGQGLAPAPWTGKVNVNGACALDISQFLEAFAQSPNPLVIAEFVQQLAQDLGINVVGDVTVSYRRMFTVINRKGNKVERGFAIPNKDDKRFIIGQRVLSAEEIAVSRRKASGEGGFDYDEGETGAGVEE